MATIHYNLQPHRRSLVLLSIQSLLQFILPKSIFKKLKITWELAAAVSHNRLCENLTVPASVPKF